MFQIRINFYRPLNTDSSAFGWEKQAERAFGRDRWRTGARYDCFIRI